jgi:hypothetical protein
MLSDYETVHDTDAMPLVCGWSFECLCAQKYTVFAFPLPCSLEVFAPLWHSGLSMAHPSYRTST